MQMRHVQVGQHDIKLRVSSSLREKEILLTHSRETSKNTSTDVNTLFKKNPSTDPSKLEMRRIIVAEDHLTNLITNWFKE